MSFWFPRGGGASLPEGPVLTPADGRSPARPLANDWAVVAFTLCGPLAAVLAARLAVGRLPITANLRRRMGFEIDAVAIVALVAVTVSAVIVARDPGLLPGQRTGDPRRGGSHRDPD